VCVCARVLYVERGPRRTIFFPFKKPKRIIIPPPPSPPPASGRRVQYTI